MISLIANVTSKARPRRRPKFKLAPKIYVLSFVITCFHREEALLGAIDLRAPGAMDLRAPGAMDFRAPGAIDLRAPGVIDLR